LKSLWEELAERAIEAKKRLSGLRMGKRINGIFERLGYLTADNFVVLNYPRRPLAAFNPSVVLDGDDVYLFPRFIFDYYDYVSSIGLTKLSKERLDKPCCSKLPSKIIIYPTTVHEIKRGAEDPRAHEFRGDFLVFYTAVGVRDDGLWPKQGVAIVSKDGGLVHKGVLRLGGAFPASWKNTTMIKDKGSTLSILTRPLIEGHEVVWRGELSVEEWDVDPASMEVVLVPEKFEIKVGVSTTPVRIGSNEYLIGWHAISKEDLSYRNGLAVVNGEGELLGITEYLLYPQTVEEMYGDRPMVIYGCGLLRVGEFVYWIGGVADYGIGIYKASLDDIMEHVKWLRG